MELQEKLYTSTEVAQILGVSLRSVYRYMEEGKLDAEVKTATGRHRFTKKNILDFLYPNGSQSEKNDSKEVRVDTRKLEKVEMPVATPVSDQLSDQSASNTIPPVPNATPVVDAEKPEIEETPIDWLAKFREAASKFKASEEPVTQPKPIESAPTPVAEPLRTQPVQQPIQQPARPIHQAQPIVEEKLSNITDFTTKEEVPVYDDSTKFFYYRSMVGGLKDIAQSIDKNARRASVEYAFTLNAGLSLHKPIKPFSILHIYANQTDLEFYERSLNLVTSDFRDAQLCIMIAPDKSILKERREIHGLYVVSDIQLRRDLIEAGEHSLVSELESIIRF